MPRHVQTYESSLAARRMKRIETLLSDGKPRTAAKIAVEIFMDTRWCGAYMKHMHSIGRAHIADWFRHGSPMYLAGPGKDAKEPKLKTSAQSTREYHKRMKKNPDYVMKLRARDRARRTNPGWTGKRRVILGVAAA